VRRAIGFRAEADKVHWAVVEGTKHTPILIGTGIAAAPVDLSEASALSWYANRLRLLVEAHRPDVAMVRSIEPMAPSSRKEGPRQRLRIEGVLLQTMDSCGLRASTGAFATISANLGASAKSLLASKKYRELDLAEIPDYSREAVLVAVAALQ
jgi:hypothetical protein